MKKFLNSNTFYAIVSVIIAILLWVYVVYEVSPAYEMWIEDVNIKCINKSTLFDDGSIAVSGDNDKFLNGGETIDIKIRGKRNIVSSVDKDDILCTLDMITVTGGGSYSLKPDIEIKTSGVEIVSTSKSNIKFEVENINQHDIEVEIKTKGKIPKNYEMIDLTNSVSSVKVTGMASVIDKIDRAYVILDYSSLDISAKEVSLPIEFVDKNNEVIDTNLFDKSVEYSKLTFKLVTTLDTYVRIMPQYDEGIKKNTLDKSVQLYTYLDEFKRDKQGVKMKVTLKGTHDALAKYKDEEQVVYTEPIHAQNIYSDKDFKNVKAATLSNDVDYVEVPLVNVKALVGK